MKTTTIGAMVCGAAMALSGCARGAAAPEPQQPFLTTVAPPTATATPSAASPVASKARTLLGDLFDAGRVFRYAVVTESSYYDPADARADKEGYVVATDRAEILCAVADVHEHPVGRVARLDCGPEGNQIGIAGASIAGVYLLASSGLYRFGLETRDEEITADLPPSALLLAKDPVANKKIEEDDEHSAVHEVAQEPDGAWCTRDAVVYGDASANADCFVAGKGIVRALREFSGGSTHTTTFTAI